MLGAWSARSWRTILFGSSRHGRASARERTVLFAAGDTALCAYLRKISGKSSGIPATVCQEWKELTCVTLHGVAASTSAGLAGSSRIQQHKSARNLTG
eukprot:g16997.t1